jgi:membrane protein
MTGRRIRGPLDLRRRAWADALRRVLLAVWNNRVTDWAAALTYYSVLSLFPGLLLLVALLSLLGTGSTDALISAAHQIGPGNETGVLVDAVRQLQTARPYSGPLAIFGFLSALYTSSSYLGAFIRAANTLYEVDEGRAAWKTIPLRFGLTVLVVLIVAGSAAGLLVTGDFANDVGRWLGVSRAAVTVWNVAKWPVLILPVSLVCSLLYWAAPNVRQPGFRWLTPGSLVAVVVWLVVSAGFTLYIGHFGSYNKVYGSLGGAVVFLLWLWLINLAILLGAAFDAELARERGIEVGQSATRQPILPPRDMPEDDDARPDPAATDRKAFVNDRHSPADRHPPGGGRSRR